MFINDERQYFLPGGSPPPSRIEREVDLLRDYVRGLRDQNKDLQFEISTLQREVDALKEVVARITERLREEDWS